MDRINGDATNLHSMGSSKLWWAFSVSTSFFLPVIWLHNWNNCQEQRPISSEMKTENEKKAILHVKYDHFFEWMVDNFGIFFFGNVKEQFQTHFILWKMKVISAVQHIGRLETRNYGIAYAQTLCFAEEKRRRNFDCMNLQWHLCGSFHVYA